MNWKKILAWIIYFFTVFIVFSQLALGALVIFSTISKFSNDWIFGFSTIFLFSFWVFIDKIILFIETLKND